jgi:hypothetical protein
MVRGECRHGQAHGRSNGLTDRAGGQRIERHSACAQRWARDLAKPLGFKHTRFRRTRCSDPGARTPPRARPTCATLPGRSRQRQTGIKPSHAPLDIGHVDSGVETRWCVRLGSNQQPLPSEGSTLSIELRTPQQPRILTAGLYPSLAEVHASIIERFDAGKPAHRMRRWPGPRCPAPVPETPRNS